MFYAFFLFINLAELCSRNLLFILVIVGLLYYFFTFLIFSILRILFFRWGVHFSVSEIVTDLWFGHNAWRNMFITPKRTYIAYFKRGYDPTLSPQCIQKDQAFVLDSDLKKPLDAQIKVGILTSTKAVAERDYSTNPPITFSFKETIIVTEKINIVEAPEEQRMVDGYYLSSVGEFLEQTTKLTSQQIVYNSKYQTELEEALEKTHPNQNKTMQQQLATFLHSLSQDHKVQYTRRFAVQSPWNIKELSVLILQCYFCPAYYNVNMINCNGYVDARVSGLQYIFFLFKKKIIGFM